MATVPDQNVQQQIYTFIEKNPGLYVSKLAELLDIPVTVVDLHLSELQKKDKVIATEEDGYKRFYVSTVKVGFRLKKMHQIREKIYDLVDKNPGLHLSKIAEMMGIRISLAEYHLLQLEQINRVVAEKGDGFYKRYYVYNNRITEKQKTIIGLLRQEIPLQIVLYLLKNPDARHKEMLQDLELTTSTLTYHLHKLVKEGLVVAPDFGEKGYSIADRKTTIGYLKKYRIYTVADYFKEVWGET